MNLAATIEIMNDPLDKFYECQTQQDAEEFLSTLEDSERRSVLMRTESAKLSWLIQDVDVSMPLHTYGSHTFTQKEANAIYDSLFYLMKSAKDAADKEKKPLHTIMCEHHVDNDGLFVSSMIMRIAKRLNICDLGIELCEKSFVTEKNREVPGLEDIKKELEEKRMKREADNSKNHLRSKNFWYQLLLAEELKMSHFASDPLHANDFIAGRSKEMNESREKAMIDLLCNKSNDLISLYGYSHMQGLVPALKDRDDAITLFIDTSNLASLYIEEKFKLQATPILAETTALPSNKNEASLLGTNHEASEIIHVQVPGKNIETAEKALEMAKAADNARGLTCARETSTWAHHARKTESRWTR